MAVALGDRRRARRRATWRRRRLVLLLMSPWLVGFSVFFGYPLVMSAYLSFNHYDLLSAPRWVGLANYRYLLTVDPQVWTAVRNTLWLIAVMVPLQVVFAYGIAMLLARAKSGVGIWRTIFYLPALAPPVAATLGFVFILNPATGPVNTILGHLGIQGPLWFQDPAWSKPSLTLLGLWGVGNTMVIFLAAVLDVPRHLYESAELDGAGPLQRLRWVTLPTTSPVILFAVILGVIQGLQYFTQAYVAAGVASGQASQAGDVTAGDARLPARLDARLSRAALPARLHRLPDGLRVGDGDAAARRVVRGDLAHLDQLAQVGSLRRGCPMTATATTAAAFARRRVPAAVRRRRFLLAVANHAVLIGFAIAFLAPFIFIALTALMTNNQALSPDLWPQPFRWRNFVDVWTKAPLWRWVLNTLQYSVLSTLGLVVSSVPVAYALARLRWRGRQAMFMVVLVALMLPPQVTVVPLYVMWAKFHPFGINFIGTLWPVILPNWFGDAFSIFLLAAVLSDDPRGVPRCGAGRRLR